ncbi:hypothetical protein [Pontiella desulfatans]|uniref:hypothetical protein n=1 Tax=Pontiella desulfatans TaxID=2750659 RepID=UPI00109C21A2|nr:hypothetical protein [Pontiella desulfatans]
MAEHIEHAEENDQRPVYKWIRELLEQNLKPIVFVWKRIPADHNWRQAEKDAISFWSESETIEFPYIHSPQTPKSETVIINRVKLENATEGG